MSEARLLDVARLVQDAFRDAAVFERQPGGTEPLTQEVLGTRNGPYVALLAGAVNAGHQALAVSDPRRRSLHDYPLRLRGGGEVEVGFVLRPLRTRDDATENEHALPFAPGEDIPWVAVREFHLRLFDLAENPLGLRVLRVEYDPAAAVRRAQESWLRPWQRRLATNPAHAPWHVHVNSGDGENAHAERAAYTDDDLRLALSAPNPLTLVLSFAAWYQRVLLRGYGRS